MERDCESKLSKLNIEQNACIYHFGASVIHGQRSNILRLRLNGENCTELSTFLKCMKKYVVGSEKEFQAPYMRRLQKFVREIKENREVEEHFMIFEEMWKEAHVAKHEERLAEKIRI